MYGTVGTLEFSIIYYARWAKNKNKNKNKNKTIQNKTKQKRDPLFTSFFSTKESKMDKKLPMWANLRMLALRWWKLDEIW